MSILLSICCVEEKKQREEEGREGREEEGREGREEQGREGEGRYGEEVGEERRGVGHVNLDNAVLCCGAFGERGVTGLEKTTGLDDLQDFWQGCVWWSR